MSEMQAADITGYLAKMKPYAFQIVSCEDQQVL